MIGILRTSAKSKLQCTAHPSRHFVWFEISQEPAGHTKNKIFSVGSRETAAILVKNNQ